MTDKLVPTNIPSWQMPYWDGLKEHKVVVQRCSGCGAYRFVPKEMCNKCFSEEWTWESIKGTGRIYTHTTIRRPPTPAYADDIPYTIVHVEMDEGIRMIGHIKGVAPEDVKIDAPVKATFSELGDWTILDFEPA